MRRAFDALNAGDPYVFLEAYDPEIELWASSSWGLESGVVRGAKEVELWFAHEFAGWGNQHYELEQLIEWGPHVVVLGRWVGKAGEAAYRCGRRGSRCSRSRTARS